MIYKMRMGDPIEINLVPLGFSAKELSNQVNSQVKNDVSSTLTVIFQKRLEIEESVRQKMGAEQRQLNNFEQRLRYSVVNKKHLCEEMDYKHKIILCM